ncbi:rho GTPase-activating protein 39-like isoform X2 [Eurosta solidaginis]|uniref:rho GTPase-activating protein 39-like isoform X2 n=1 Tax=Eurosta solidaginis TaxID=178769 RepID=UPI0035306B21
MPPKHRKSKTWFAYTCLGINGYLFVFVPPSPTFQPTLLNYINRHRDPSFTTSFPEVGKWRIHVQISHYATVCCRRLDRIVSHGRRQAKRPTEDEVEQARNQILRVGMFGSTIAEVMELQRKNFLSVNYHGYKLHFQSMFCY